MLIGNTMKNLDSDNPAPSLDQSNESLFKEQSTQTLLTSSEIERNGLLVEVDRKGKISPMMKLVRELGNKKERRVHIILLSLKLFISIEKRKRVRRKKIISDSKNDNQSEEMEGNCSFVEETLSKPDKNKKHLKNGKVCPERNSNQTKKASPVKLKPDNASKERLFDPISKKYVKQKNNENNQNKSSKKSDKKVLNSESKINGNKIQTNPNFAKKKNQNANDKNSFPPHYIHEMVEKGLKEGLLVEGTLRINPKNYEEAFVTNDMKNELDIYIGGMLNRNRALNGDEVIVDILPESEWRVNNELIEDYLQENDLKGLPHTSSNAINENNSEMIVKFERLGVRFDLSKDIEHLNDSLPLDNESDTNSVSIHNALNDGYKGEYISENSETDRKNDDLVAQSDSNGMCVPIEDLEEADFDTVQNSTVDTKEIQSDCESLVSSDGADIVIDDVMEVNETKSKTQTCLDASVNSVPIVNDISPSSEKSNQEKKPRTRRKRGSKKKKEGSKYNDRNFIKKGVDIIPQLHIRYYYHAEII